VGHDEFVDDLADFWWEAEEALRIAIVVVRWGRAGGVGGIGVAAVGATISKSLHDMLDAFEHDLTGGIEEEMTEEMGSRKEVDLHLFLCIMHR
jgi:hypothetical protein